MSQKTNLTVALKSEKRSQEFPIQVANKLLKMTNAQWSLSDSRYKWNGLELALKNKKDKSEEESKKD